MTAEQKDAALKAGKDPEVLAATAGATDYSDWKKRRDAAKKEK
jgi:hypothetical protein